MNNKQKGVVGVGSSMNRDSPSPPPSALCFPSRRNSGAGTNDKKVHPHHQYDPYQNVGLCGCRRTSKSRCISAIGKYKMSIEGNAGGDWAQFE